MAGTEHKERGVLDCSQMYVRSTAYRTYHTWAQPMLLLTTNFLPSHAVWTAIVGLPASAVMGRGSVPPYSD
jgi:hypothetical protein